MLNYYGKMILSDAAKIVELEDSILDQTNNYNAQKRITINLGILPTFSNYPIFKKIMCYQSSHPNINIVFHELETNQLLPLLDEDKLDILFYDL
ncbi:hypothetical protein IMAU30005_01360 [Lactobacillus helveticus]|nr:hypothetical protein [Lactobacillus helveticus]